MKLLKEELKDKIYFNVYGKVLKHAPWNSPVRWQIRKKIGWRDGGDNSIRLKIDNQKFNIMNDLDEIT